MTTVPPILPDWGESESDAVKKLIDIIGPEIEKKKLELESARKKEKLIERIEILSGWPDSAPAPKRERASKTDSDVIERWVLDVAMRGEMEPLAKQIMPLPSSKRGELKVNPTIATLSPETWLFVTDLIWSHHRNQKKRGRKKMSAEERRKVNPYHDARDEVVLIILILKRLYPGRRMPWRKMAVEIAAKRNRLEVSTLDRHVARAKSDKRRVS